MKRLRKVPTVVVLVFALVLCGTVSLLVGNAYAANSTTTQEMYRMYNRISSEHLYTKDVRERDILTHGDWTYEGIAWIAPEKSDTPVYRLYNPFLGDHHYTANKQEVDILTARYSWKYEGIGWYSSDSKEYPVYRQYNPGLRTGQHNYTADINEYNINNARNGWQGENIAWYAIQPNPYLGKQVNILIMGSDSRESSKYPLTWRASNERADAMMLLQISGDRKHITAMSLPRGIAATMPSGDKMGRSGLTMPLNMAYEGGGPEGQVRAIQNLTGIPIHHWLLVDFTSFQKLVNQAGGVPLRSVLPTFDTLGNLALPGNGVTTLANGQDALRYVRSRKNLGEDDVDRVRRQQYFMKELHAKVMTPEILTDPVKLQQLYTTYNKYVIHDNGFTMDKAVALGRDIAGVKNDSILFYTPNVSGRDKSSPDPAAGGIQYVTTTLDWNAFKINNLHWKTGTAYEYANANSVNKLTSRLVQ